MHRLNFRTNAVLSQLQPTPMSTNNSGVSAATANEKTPAPPSPALALVPGPSPSPVPVIANAVAGSLKSSPDNSHLVVRRLAITDYDKGYLQLLSELTAVGNVTRQQFEERFRQMEAVGCYVTIVIEDTTKGLIIATATLLLEHKFIHGCGTIGHVEDVVVNTTYRGQNLGIRVMEALKSVGRERGCYKIILDCSVSNTKFYAKLGFVEKERQMALYYSKAADSADSTPKGKSTPLPPPPPPPAASNS